MKSGFLLSAAAALILSGSSAAFASTHVAPKHAASKHVTSAHPAVAPLDEYFGREKLSPLGIENTIHDTNLRVRYDPAHAQNYYQSLAWAQDALGDWARKYPQDPWLPGRAYFMSHVFWQMHLAQADQAADRCRSLLFKQFPHSHWAKIARYETKERVAPLPVAATH